MSKEIFSNIFLQDPYNPVCLMSVAAYDTEYYEKLDVIRNFRDKFLLNRGNYLGKLLVREYYKLGVILSPRVKNSRLCRKVILNFLVRPLLGLFSLF
jgi:hypothetical protein